MPDNFDEYRTTATPLLAPEENDVQTDPKRKGMLRLKPRICFIITKKKNSSWVDDICNHEMLAPENRIFH
ncbi:MAG: hypothetical protein ACWGOX_10150 [Desulforhopalus sp.]